MREEDAQSICAILFKLFFRFVAKGYWVKQATIASTDLFMEYIQTVVPWLLSVGGTIIAKDIKQNSDVSHWDGGQLGVIVEFESKEAARKAFYSEVFQEFIQINGLESDLTLSIFG